MTHKSAIFTDIHFGGKSNSIPHNEDCTAFVDWFIDNLTNDITEIMFLGDWFENRSALDVSTLNYSHTAASKLNSVGLPVYFVIGNHDLYKRHTRDIHSPELLSEFDNFIIIDTPQTYEFDKPILMCPFMFHDEYPELIQKYGKIPNWFGHFEFKDFVITGYSTKMKSGPDPKDFGRPHNILSGHFHKRQSLKNITYIGNTFPSNFGDVDDVDRGMAIFDHKTEKVTFKNWTACPQYKKLKLSTLLDDPNLPEDSRVKCIVDIPIDYSEASVIRETFMKQFNLREFTLEETAEIREALEQTEVDEDIVEVKTGTNTNDMVCEMLTGIDTKHIDNEMLIKIYQDLQVIDND